MDPPAAHTAVEADEYLGLWAVGPLSRGPARRACASVSLSYYVTPRAVALEPQVICYVLVAWQA
jgi:hypothetical protein